MSPAVPIIVLLVALPAPTGATVAPQPEPVAPLPRADSIAGTWRIHYDDTVMGRVRGTAVIENQETTARVTLTHPLTRQEYTLTSGDVRREGNTVSMTLRGASPGGNRTPLRRWPNSTDITVEPGVSRATVTIGGRELSLELAPLAAPTNGIVRLVLDRTSDGDLVGSWSYIGHPTTLADAANQGRHGDVTLSDQPALHARVRGREVWVRPGRPAPPAPPRPVSDDLPPEIRRALDAAAERDASEDAPPTTRPPTRPLAHPGGSPPAMPQPPNAPPQPLAERSVPPQPGAPESGAATAPPKDPAVVPPGVDPAAPDLALDRAPSGPAGDATAPAPGSTIRDSRTAVARSYTLGARLGASGGFVEYEIADPPDPGSTLKAADAAFGDPIERLRSVEAGRAALSGALPHRLLPIRAVLPDARPPCFVQQRVEPPAITVAAASRTAPGLTPEQQSAVVDLFADLAAADLIWEDGRPENILLRPGPDGRWEALVIAPERLAPIANWSADPALERLVPLIQTAPLHRSVGLLSLAESAIAPGAATALQRGVQLLPDAGAFMVKMLEYKGRYIRFDRAARRFDRVLIDPELVRRRFPDLDRLVDAPLTPTMILPRAAPSNPDTLPPPAPPR